MTWTFRLCGRVVKNPALIAVVIAMTIIFGLVVLALSPILIPLHFVLRRYGLKGFYSNRHICIGTESFKPYDPVKCSNR